MPRMPYGSRVAPPACRNRSTWSASLASVVLIASSCGGPSTETPPPTSPVEPRSTGTSIEVAELDINWNGIDRFVNCPPPGELGQDWIPPLPPWTPPAVSGPADSAPLPPDDVTMHG